MRSSVSSGSSSSTTTVSSWFPLRGALQVLALAGMSLAAGCSTVQSTVDGSPTLRRVVTFFAPYRADVIQGNVVTSEQIARVKPGMTRVQVRDVLGTPLIADPFHADRWDYVFTMQRQGIPPVKRAFTVFFKEDAVAEIKAPELPTENQFVADISTRPLPKSSPKLELTDAEKAALPAPPADRAAAPAAAASAGTGPTRTYPPLEPQ